MKPQLDGSTHHLRGLNGLCILYGLRLNSWTNHVRACNTWPLPSSQPPKTCYPYTYPNSAHRGLCCSNCAPSLSVHLSYCFLCAWHFLCVGQNPGFMWYRGKGHWCPLKTKASSNPSSYH